MQNWRQFFLPHNITSGTRVPTEPANPEAKPAMSLAPVWTDSSYPRPANACESGDRQPRTASVHYGEVYPTGGLATPG